LQRLPRHLFDEGVLIPEKNITITELDHELDAVDSIYCDVEADSEDPHKRYIVGGWDKFVRERKIDIGDRLLFTIENVPDHIFVQFIDSDRDFYYDSDWFVVCLFMFNLNLVRVLKTAMVLM